MVLIHPATPNTAKFAAPGAAVDGSVRVSVNHPHCAEFCVLGGGLGSA